MKKLSFLFLFLFLLSLPKLGAVEENEEDQNSKCNDSQISPTLKFTIPQSDYKEWNKKGTNAIFKIEFRQEDKDKIKIKESLPIRIEPSSEPAENKPIVLTLETMDCRDFRDIMLYGFKVWLEPESKGSDSKEEDNEIFCRITQVDRESINANVSPNINFVLSNGDCTSHIGSSSSSEGGPK